MGSLTVCLTYAFALHKLEIIVCFHTEKVTKDALRYFRRSRSKDAFFEHVTIGAV